MRKKLKYKIAIPQMEQARDVLPDNLNREEMTQIIADAIVLAEEQREKKETETRMTPKAEGTRATWLNHQPFRMISQVLTLLLSPYKVISGDGAILEFLRVFLDIVFCILEIICVIAGFVFIKSAFDLSQEYYIIILELLYCAVSLIIAVLFHIVRAEIQNTDDKNYLLNLSTLVGTIGSIVVAIFLHINGGK